MSTKGELSQQGECVRSTKCLAVGCSVLKEYQYTVTLHIVDTLIRAFFISEKIDTINGDNTYSILRCFYQVKHTLINCLSCKDAKNKPTKKIITKT